MDEPVDLTPRAADPAERHTALALAAVLGSRDDAAPRRAGADDVLADVQRRAARLHRRRAGAGALTAAAVVALALTVPSLLPTAGTERPAAPAQGTPAPDDGEPEAGPSSAIAHPLLSDAQVGALYPGVVSSGDSGSIALGPSRRPAPAVGGYCGDTALDADGPRQTWEASWKKPGTSGDGDVLVREKVLRWEGPDAGEAVERYTRATRGSTLVCDGAEGGTYEQPIATEPGGAPASQAVLAPGSVTAPDGGRSTWRVRSISPAGDGATVVELTVDLPAPDGREAARSVAPLLAAALGRAAPRGDRPSATEDPAELPPGPAGALSDRAPDVPRSGPTQPQPSPAWRLPLSDASTLTLEQVRSVVPAAVPREIFATPRPAIFVPGCDGLPSLPPGVGSSAGEQNAAWTAPGADGEPVVEVSERVVRWDGWGQAQAYVDGMRDAATACTTDPADPVDQETRASTPWREVQLRAPGGGTIDALVRPAGADRPGTWVLRAALAPTVGTTAVDVQVTARAGSPDALVAVLAPLLTTAADRAAADQLRAFARGDVDQPGAP